MRSFGTSVARLMAASLKASLLPQRQHLQLLLKARMLLHLRLLGAHLAVTLVEEAQHLVAVERTDDSPRVVPRPLQLQ